MAPSSIFIPDSRPILVRELGETYFLTAPSSGPSFLFLLGECGGGGEGQESWVPTCLARERARGVPTNHFGIPDLAPPSQIKGWSPFLRSWHLILEKSAICHLTLYRIIRN